MNYFVTFRHRRTLEQSECQLLMRALMNAHGRKWSIKLICILADRSDLIVHMIEDEDLKSKELSEVLEKAKSKAGKQIIKKSQERFPPFYSESYDRIIRDDAEFEDFFQQIIQSTQDSDWMDETGDYPFIWAPDAY